MEALFRAVHTATAAALARGVEHDLIMQSLDRCVQSLYELPTPEPAPRGEPSMSASTSLPALTPGKKHAAARTETFTPVRRGLDVWGRPLPLPPAQSPLGSTGKPDLMATRRADRLAKQGIVAVTPVPAMSASGPLKIESPSPPQHEQASAETPPQPSTAAAANAAITDAAATATGTDQASNTPAANFAPPIAAAESPSPAPPPSLAKRRWQESTGKVVEERRPRGARALLDRAARRFNAAADIKRQRIRAAAHLIGTLRTRAQASGGKVSREDFYEVLDDNTTMGSLVDALSDDLFDAIDKDKSNSLSCAELERAVRGLLDPKSSTQVDALLNLGDDVMSTSVSQMQEALGAQAARVIDLFKKADKDGDGVVSRSEFFRAMPMLGMVGNTPEEIDALFATFDPSGDGSSTQYAPHNPYPITCSAWPRYTPLIVDT